MIAKPHRSGHQCVKMDHLYIKNEPGQEIKMQSFRLGVFVLIAGLEIPCMATSSFESESHQTYVQTAPAGTVVVTHFPLNRILTASGA